MDKKQVIMIVVAIVILLAAITLIAMNFIGGSGTDEGPGPTGLGLAEPTTMLPDGLVSI